ncbi:hypothetical protein BDF21DRAFT_477564 [Thamnidium elegans]|nr:hypothetical protein BDF21DRAFT_477564 [Thamnidium elegans]
MRYVKTKATVSSTLYGYYGNESKNPTEVYFPDSYFGSRVDKKCNLYYGSLFVAKIRSFFPQPERESDDHSFKREFYYNYLQIMLQQPHITKRLDDQKKNTVFELTQQDNYVQNISVVLESLQFLSFRKLKFSSKLFYDQVNNLRGKFGQDDILVFGDGYAPNTKFHEPTRNKGLIPMLKKKWFYRIPCQ